MQVSLLRLIYNYDIFIRSLIIICWMGEKIITWEEYEKHIYSYDCWVMIDQMVYNVNDYLVEHPGGDDILVRFSGRDGTQPFNNVPHSDYAVSLRNARLMGKIETPSPPEGYLQRIDQKKKKALKAAKKTGLVKRTDKIPMAQVALHKSEQNCWIVLNGKVLDVTEYLVEHPGGVGKIMQFAGQDATKAFNDVNHSMSAQQIADKFCIGEVQKKSNNLLLIVAVLAILAGLLYIFL